MRSAAILECAQQTNCSSLPSVVNVPRYLKMASNFVRLMSWLVERDSGAFFLLLE